MITTINLMFYVFIGILIGCLITITMLYVLLSNKYKELLDKYYDNKQQYLHKYNQISMIEYYYRNYNEGKNAFTVLKDIGKVISSDKIICNIK